MARNAEFIIQNRFRLDKKLGGGSFGDVFQGTDIETGQLVAIKIELKKCKHPQLKAEAQLYKILGEGDKELTGITHIYYIGEQDDYNVMVMDFLGPSLEDLFQYNEKAFSIKTVLMLADQCLQILERVHDCGYIHRDIKPDNFVMGYGKNIFYVYMIDFGLAKKYVNDKGEHIPYNENRSLTGTARYASINNHLGREQSRRDDLESLAYMFIYFLKGKLPWQGVARQNNNGDYDRILQKKRDISSSELCEGIPFQFEAFLNYSRMLEYEQRPDYAFWRRSFMLTAVEYYCEYDGQYDWYNKK